MPATNLATTILARGEFSLIIAALGAEAGLDARVVPFVAGYVLILALGRADPRRAVGAGSPAACPGASCATPAERRGPCGCGTRRVRRSPVSASTASR